MSTKPTSKSSDAMENFAKGLLKSIWTFLRICFHGIKRVKFKSFDTWCLILVVAIYLGILTLGKTNHLYTVFDFVFRGQIPFYFNLFFKMGNGWQFTTLFLAFISGSLILLGFRNFRQYVKFQKAIQRAGLKTAINETPKVEKIIPIDENRSKVIVETYGVGIDTFEAKKKSLTSGFRQTVQSIELSEDKGKVEIFLVEKDLPKMVGFYELYKHIKEPYSFIIGKSLKGPIVQPIRSLPHLLISGATGGGKSVFFRSTILSLLKSSPHLQMYLLDLKRGVEVKEFSELPNIKVAKDEVEATNILGSIVEEMNRRYTYLEDKGYKSIDPKRDKLDLIVVGIDEAASLFGDKSNELARKYIGQLARLARAAGIHLIPSTQKPVKDAIDTETLDNLPGRMTFRMISTAASNAAMGGNLAKNLSPAKGRAMWTNGSEHKEVQAPYVDDALVQSEIKLLLEEFDSGMKENFQPLLTSGKTTFMTDFKVSA